MPWHASAQRSRRAERLSSVGVTMDMSREPDDIAPRTSTLRCSRGYSDPALSVSELFRDLHLELVRLAVVMVVVTWLPPRTSCRTALNGCTAAGT
jgi:hypothetical protein